MYVFCYAFFLRQVICPSVFQNRFWLFKNWSFHRAVCSSSNHHNHSGTSKWQNKKCECELCFFLASSLIDINFPSDRVARLDLKWPLPHDIHCHSLCSHKHWKYRDMAILHMTSVLCCASATQLHCHKTTLHLTLLVGCIGEKKTKNHQLLFFCVVT